MSDSTIKRGLQNSIDNFPITDGKIYFSTDQMRIFMDTAQERLEFSDLVYGLTHNDIFNLTDPLPKVYLSTDTHEFLTFDFAEDKWISYFGPTGPMGLRGPQGPVGLDGAVGPTGADGLVGPTGATGEGFSIFKTYSSIEDMESDAENVPEGKFVIILSDNEDNGKLYVMNDSGEFIQQSTLSDAQGIIGPTGVAGPTGPSGQLTTNLDLGQYWVTVLSDADEVNKVAEQEGFILKPGGIVVVKFVNGNSAMDATLNINSTGDKLIQYNGTNVAPYFIKAGDEVTAMYNGSTWNIIDFDDYGDLDEDYVNL